MLAHGRFDMKRYLSFRKAWPNTLMIGISVTWSSDKTLCFMIHLITHVLLIGPHLSSR